MKKTKVLNAVILIASLLGTFCLASVGIEGEHPVALVFAFVLGGIGFADAFFYWDKHYCD